MIPETVAEAARRFGETPAFVDEAGRALTYEELHRRSDAVAAGMLRAGVGPGDVVAVALTPGLDYVAAYAGAAKVGAVTAGVNHRLPGMERARLFAKVDPALVIEHGEEVASLADTGGSDGRPPALADDPDRPVAIIFTSGTTGEPKGAVYCNRQLAFITANDVGDAWGGGGAQLTGTPFAHLGFTTKFPGNLRRGATTHILSRWRAEAALALMAEHRMPVVAGVPTQLALMLSSPAFADFDPSHVQAIVVGGAPITPDLAVEARERFGAPLAVRYSCTEAGIGLGTAFDGPPEDAVVSVGRPLPGVELALLDESDRPVAEGPDGEGVVGAVCLRSPAMMSGYWNDPERTAEAFTADGYVRTGDLGSLDGAGRLHLVGRSKEMYVRGGENVYPVEVEAALAEHPGVTAVAVVPRADAVMGEIGVAVVVPEATGGPPDLESLRAVGAQRLASYKLPEDLVLVDELPLTPGDKIDRRALRDTIGP